MANLIYAINEIKEKLDEKLIKSLKSNYSKNLTKIHNNTLSCVEE